MPNVLWTVPYQASGKVIRAVAAITGYPLQLAQYEHFVDNKKSEYLTKFPHGKIPALEVDDRFKLFEGVPIARYIAGRAPETGLLGIGAENAALVDQWVHLAEQEISDSTTFIMGLVRGYITPYNKPIHDRFSERERRALKTLNDHLATRTFFVGERITLADIYIAGIVSQAVTVSVDAVLRPELPHLIRHLETVANQPKIKDIFGPIQYVEKALQF
ncbi:hypothetical protein H0H93_014814, partial [Arthromyces matolae]